MQHEPATNITTLGAVGHAAGKLLLPEFTCASADCSDAVKLCQTTPRCDTVEMRIPVGRAAQPRRRRNGSILPAQQSTALLRASWTTWGTKDPALNENLRECQGLFREARSTPPKEWLTKVRRLHWQQSYCDEYVASGADALPDFGRELTPREQLPPGGGGATCPPAGTELFVVTYQNGPSPWLCTFLRTLGYRGVHVTVLGWQPAEFVRMNNVFYFTDRVYTLLRYLLACRDNLSPTASIMFCDVDELYQLQGGLAELSLRAQQLYQQTSAEVVVSAEARCMPNRLGPKSWAHSEEVAARLGITMAKKWPRCLNTGNFVGRIGPTIHMLNRTCIPCRDGTPVAEVHRRYSRAYSAQVKGWIYSEQAELMRLYLDQPSNVSGWVLDYKQLLFHPNFWFTAAWDTRVLADGRLHNKHTGSTPAFMHYNGDSKSTWRGAYSPRALARALRAAYTQRTGDTKLANLEPYLREGVNFLGPSFGRDATVGWGDVCKHGSIGGESEEAPPDEPATNRAKGRGGGRRRRGGVRE